jgi:hypothetical protein
MEFLSDLGWVDPETPLGYIGKITGRLELSRLPEMAEAMGSSKEEDACRISRGNEKPSMNEDSPPPDEYALISTAFRTSIAAPAISN